jgi:hypothetical protein
MYNPFCAYLTSDGDLLRVEQDEEYRKRINAWKTQGKITNGKWNQYNHDDLTSIFAHLTTTNPKFFDRSTLHTFLDSIIKTRKISCPTIRLSPIVIHHYRNHTAGSINYDERTMMNNLSLSHSIIGLGGDMMYTITPNGICRISLFEWQTPNFLTIDPRLNYQHQTAKLENDNKTVHFKAVQTLFVPDTHIRSKTAYDNEMERFTNDQKMITNTDEITRQILLLNKFPHPSETNDGKEDTDDVVIKPSSPKHRRKLVETTTADFASSISSGPISTSIIPISQVSVSLSSLSSLSSISKLPVIQPLISKNASVNPSLSILNDSVFGRLTYSDVTTSSNNTMLHIDNKEKEKKVEEEGEREEEVEGEKGKRSLSSDTISATPTTPTVNSRPQAPEIPRQWRHAFTWKYPSKTSATKDSQCIILYGGTRITDRSMDSFYVCKSLEGMPIVATPFHELKELARKLHNPCFFATSPVSSDIWIIDNDIGETLETRHLKSLVRNVEHTRKKRGKSRNNRSGSPGHGHIEHKDHKSYRDMVTLSDGSDNNDDDDDLENVEKGVDNSNSDSNHDTSGDDGNDDNDDNDDNDVDDIEGDVVDDTNETSKGYRLLRAQYIDNDDENGSFIITIMKTFENDMFYLPGVPGSMILDSQQRIYITFPDLHKIYRYEFPRSRSWSVFGIGHAGKLDSYVQDSYESGYKARGVAAYKKIVMFNRPLLLTSDRPDLRIICYEDGSQQFRVICVKTDGVFTLQTPYDMSPPRHIMISSILPFTIDSTIPPISTTLSSSISSSSSSSSSISSSLSSLSTSRSQIPLQYPGRIASLSIDRSFCIIDTWTDAIAFTSLVMLFSGLDTEASLMVSKYVWNSTHEWDSYTDKELHHMIIHQQSFNAYHMSILPHLRKIEQEKLYDDQQRDKSKSKSKSKSSSRSSSSSSSSSSTIKNENNLFSLSVFHTPLSAGELEDEKRTQEIEDAEFEKQLETDKTQYNEMSCLTREKRRSNRSDYEGIRKVLEEEENEQDNNFIRPSLSEQFRQDNDDNDTDNDTDDDDNDDDKDDKDDNNNASELTTFEHRKLKSLQKIRRRKTKKAQRVAEEWVENKQKQSMSLALDNKQRLRGNGRDLNLDTNEDWMRLYNIQSAMLQKLMNGC